MKRKLRVFFLIFLIPACLLSQEYDNLSSQKEDIIKMLPPLRDLIDSAERNSPLLKMIEADLVIQKLKTISSKREWMNNIGFEANVRYGYGLLDNFVISQNFGSDLYYQNVETRYNVGLFLKIPLSNVYDRSSTKISIKEQEKAKYQLEKTLNELRQLIIVQYNNVVKAHRTLGLRTESLALYQIQAERAEKDYLNGQISISEYARLKEMLTVSLMNLEENKIEFITALQLLQEAVGIKIVLKQQ